MLITRHKDKPDWIKKWAKLSSSSKCSHLLLQTYVPPKLTKSQIDKLQHYLAMHYYAIGSALLCYRQCLPKSERSQPSQSIPGNKFQCYSTNAPEAFWGITWLLF